MLLTSFDSISRRYFSFCSILLCWLVDFFALQRLSFMGPEFAQMGTSMVTSYIMNTYSASHRDVSSPQVLPPSVFHCWMYAEKLQELGTNHCSGWIETSNNSTSTTFQWFLQHGFISCKETKGTLEWKLLLTVSQTVHTNVEPKNLVFERLSEAIKNANVAPKENPGKK